eukprot:6341080-Amphidinium_carterae.1
MVCVFAVLLETLGFKLAYRKAAFGKEVTWIGATFELHDWGVRVSLKAELLQDIANLCDEVTSKNFLPLATVRKLAGKASHAAGLLPSWRPFVAIIWGATTAPTAASSRLPVDHLSEGARWIKLFLTRVEGTVQRDFTLTSWRGTGNIWHIELDASPWGLGGILFERGAPVRYFMSPLSIHDVTTFDHAIGSSSGQQVWEGLALLVAVRLWSDRLLHPDAQWLVKSDSISTLVLAAKLTSRGIGLRMIAQELALDLAEASNFPLEAQHIPGIDNVAPDALSRQCAPHAPELPKFLGGLVQDHPPTRTD